jgi:two-component system, NtrC family, response regulator HydG
MAKILIVDDEESIRFTFNRFLVEAGYDVAVTCTYKEAISALDAMAPDLVIADIILENGGTGIDILREVRKREMGCPVIMVTGAPNVETAAEAVRLGAFDYIAKPVNQEMLLRVTSTAMKYRAVVGEKENYRSNLEAILRSVNDPIISMDMNGLIIEFNEAAMNICGFTRSVIGKSFKDIRGDCFGNCGPYIDQAIQTKRRVEAKRIECSLTQGATKVMNLSAFPLLDPKNTVRGVVVVLRDETLLVSLERKLESYRFHGLVGASSKMKKVFSLIEALSGTRTTVLITGETGTGKELVAEAIHSQGDGGRAPLVKVNCSALPESLLESELFGHVKGAFTGAVQDRIGRFQKANNGTIFLDEVGDLSPKIQGQLLRVLQEKEFERVGSSTPSKVDVRIVAATNKNLHEKVNHGEFRKDLYYRLKVVEISLPALRDRRDDIPLLVDHFRKGMNASFNRNIEALSNDVMTVFLKYHWPGNVRELEHVIEHAYVLCSGRTITVAHLPEDLLMESGSQQVSLQGKGEVVKAEALKAALHKVGGNKAKAARMLGINRATLYRWMERNRLTNNPL